MDEWPLDRQLSEGDIGDIVAALSSPDRLRQARAARTINDYADPADSWAVPPLQALLESVLGVPGNNALEVRASLVPVVVALGLVGDARVVRPLLVALTHPDLRLKGAAAVALGEIGDPSAIPPLIRAAGELNVGAIEALGMFRSRDAVGQLTELVTRSGDPPRQDDETPEELPAVEDVLIAACDSLGLIGDGRARAPLSGLLGFDDPDVRLHAAVALSRSGDQDALPIIVEVALEPIGGYRSRRWHAARRLVEIGDQRGATAVIDVYLRSDRVHGQRPNDTSTRHYIIRDIGRWGDSSDMSLLRWIEEHDDQALTDQGWTLGSAARRARQRVARRRAKREQIGT